MTVSQKSSGWYLALLLCSCLSSVIAGADVVWFKGITTFGTKALLVAWSLLCCSLMLRCWATRRAKPPWNRFAYHRGRSFRLPFIRSLRLRSQLMWLTCCQQLSVPPAAPSRVPIERARKCQPNLPRSNRTHRGRWPKLPTLNVHFVRAHSIALPENVTPDCFEGTVTVVQGALNATATSAPDVLALHVQPRRLVCQLEGTGMLSTTEQRALVQKLKADGLQAAWLDQQRFVIRPLASPSLPALRETLVETKRWVPVLSTGKTTVWWPLHHNQHVVLAGSPVAPLSGFVQAIGQLPKHQQPEMLIHDPDERLRTLHDTLASLHHAPDALAVARRFQLTCQFTTLHEQQGACTPTPICIVVAPSEAIWLDLQPLLTPNSGIHVVLVFHDRAPIAALRAACHQLWVIDSADPRFPSLPDAFRPAALPKARDGRVLAWSPGGRILWQGTPLRHNLFVHSPTNSQELRS